MHARLLLTGLLAAVLPAGAFAQVLEAQYFDIIGDQIVLGYLNRPALYESPSNEYEYHMPYVINPPPQPIPMAWVVPPRPRGGNAFIGGTDYGRGRGSAFMTGRGYWRDAQRATKLSYAGDATGMFVTPHPQMIPRARIIQPPRIVTFPPRER